MLTITSFETAKQVLKRPVPPKVVISLSDPIGWFHESVVKAGTTPHLILHMTDVSHPSLEWAPNEQQVHALITFLRQYEDVIVSPWDTMLIHCQGGISRSVAAGMIAFAVIGADPAGALACRTETTPARPNKLILELAASVLKRPDLLAY